MRFRFCHEQSPPVLMQWAISEGFTLTAALNGPKLILDWKIPDKDPEDGYDCWARALCATTGLAYNDVNLRIGRTKNEPISLPCKFVIDNTGFEFTHAPEGTFVSDLPDVVEPGHHIVEVYKHVFAYINDTVLDWDVDDEEDMLNTEVLGWWSMKPNVDKKWLEADYPPCCVKAHKAGRSIF